LERDTENLDSKPARSLPTMDFNESFLKMYPGVSYVFLK